MYWRLTYIILLLVAVPFLTCSGQLKTVGRLDSSFLKYPPIDTSEIEVDSGFHRSPQITYLLYVRKTATLCNARKECVSTVIRNREFHPNGKVAQEMRIDAVIFKCTVEGDTIVRNGKGVREKWYNGKLVYRTPYQDGYIHGEMRDYYPSGKVRSLTTYVGGEKHGPRILYNRDGSIRIIEHYKHHIMHGWSIYIDADLDTSSTTMYKKGDKTHINYFHKKPNILKESIPYITLEHYASLRNGHYQRFDSASTLIVEGMYSLNRKIGRWTTYHPNGQKKTEGLYKLAEGHSLSDGLKEIAGGYTHLRDSIWVFWDSEGNKLKEETPRLDGINTTTWYLMVR